MKASLLFLAGFSTFLGLADAQTPAPPSHAPVSVNDVRILPFCREHLDKEYPARDPQMPDELRVVVNSGKVHIVGKKRTGEKKVGGEPICHSGKVALLSIADRSGKLVTKGPSSRDTTDYFVVLELGGNALKSSYVELTAGKPYDWSVKAEGGTTTLRLSDADKEVISVSAPTADAKGYGFASTVRYQNNEADMSVSFD
jgi:hypothetical protein